MKSRGETKILGNCLLTGRLRYGMGGSFRRDQLTPAGLIIFEKAVEMVGRRPDYLGGSKVGIYLKWELPTAPKEKVRSPRGRRYIPTRKLVPPDLERAERERQALMVFRDWLLDNDYEAEYEYGPMKGEDRIRNILERHKGEETDWLKGLENDLLRRFVKVTIR